MKAKIKQFALLIIGLILLAMLFVNYRFIWKKIMARNQFVTELVQVAEANREPVFKIAKMIKYSSADAIDNTTEQNLQDLSIQQYSDIALYIDNGNEELTERNTVKELYVDNFKIEVGYQYGTPELYYKNPLEISKFRVLEENKIEDSLDYTIVYTNKENQKNDYTKPTFFSDCSNPITIGYVNKDIVNHYRVTKENGLVAFDGRIFNNVDINLKDLSPKISFTVHLKNNLNEDFICNMSAKLLLETEEESVKSGYIIQIADEIGYYRFFKEG